jgi:ferric-chelate reductase
MSSIVGFVTFFILVCHHTPYAQPWIFPAIAFYGLDMLLRFLRFRFKPATLSASDNQITMASQSLLVYPEYSLIFLFLE